MTAHEVTAPGCTRGVWVGCQEGFPLRVCVQALEGAVDGGWLGPARPAPGDASGAGPWAEPLRLEGGGGVL